MKNSRQEFAKMLQDYQTREVALFGNNLTKTAARGLDPERSREFQPLDIRQLAEEARIRISKGESEEKVFDSINEIHGSNVASSVYNFMNKPKTNIKEGQIYINADTQETITIENVTSTRVAFNDGYGKLDTSKESLLNQLSSGWYLKSQEDVSDTLSEPVNTNTTPEEPVEEIPVEESSKIPPSLFKSLNPDKEEPNKEVEEEPNIKDIVITLKDLNETVKDLVIKFDDVIEQQGEVKEELEETTEELGELQEQQDFEVDEEIRERKKELDNQGTVTLEEFGVAPNTTMFGARNQHTRRSDLMDDDLRNARRQRLAAKGDKGSSDMAQEFGYDVSTKRRYEEKVNIPYVTEQQLNKRKKKEMGDLPDMWQVKAEKLSVKYHPKDAENRERWVVYDNSTETAIPLYAVYKEANQQDFADRKFGKKLLRGLIQNGPQSLKAFNSVALTDETQEDTLSKPETNQQVDRQEVFEEVLARFKKAFNVALEAQNKNLYDSPLKDSLFEVLAELGVDRPVHIVEKVFQAAPAHYDAMIRKAVEFMHMDEQPFVEFASLVRETETVVPAEDVSQTNLNANMERAQTVFGSIPLQAGSEPFDKREAIRSAIPKPLLSGKIKGNIFTQGGRTL